MTYNFFFNLLICQCVVIPMIVATTDSSKLIIKENVNVNADMAFPVNEFDRIVADQLKLEHDSDKKLLSRKRRYLIFPEGSSFQIVWDGIVGVVDYTNYLILGITVALAWELPSKPPSETIKDVYAKLEDGISRNDISTNISYIEVKPPPIKIQKTNYSPLLDKMQTFPLNYTFPKLKPIFQIPMNNKYYTNSQQIHTDYYSDLIKYGQNINTRHRGNNKFIRWNKLQSMPKGYLWWKSPSRSFKSKKIHNGEYHTNNGVLKHLKNENYEQNQKRKESQSKLSYAQDQSRKGTLHHRIYPIFGKRSIPDHIKKSFNSSNIHQKYDHHVQHLNRRHGIKSDDDMLSKMERIHIRYHRSTRLTLYDKIEKYLDKMGQNGYYCVQHALCETEEKSLEKKPGSFVGELMRAIFTIPEPLSDDLKANEDRYNFTDIFKGNCAARYQYCKHSMWKSLFAT